jgi:hypothetical protein
MNIDEARAAKDALRERLQAALDEFTKNTGLTVERLDVTPCSSVYGGVHRYFVDVEVRL